MKKFTTILLILALLAGLSLLLYPTFSNYWNQYHASRAIATYSESIKQVDTKELDKLWNSAVEYNEKIKNRRNPYLMTEEEKEIYPQLLNSDGSGIMGYIEIPSIEVMLPIYHGVEDSVLAVATGHIEWSSFPVGGEGTHACISGHRGLPSAKLFTNLDKLVTGDVFMLCVLDQVLTYEVDQILIVEPNDATELTIVNGEDYCTLITCTPYGINSHRLLVRGHRIENAETAREIRVVADAMKIDPIIVAPVIAMPILLVLLILLLVMKSGGSNRKRGMKVEE